jgi:hypothetical protein
MIGRGRGGCDTQLRLGSRLLEQTAPASPHHGAAPPGTALGGVGREWAKRAPPGTGVQGISRGPLATTPGASQGKGGPGGAAGWGLEAWVLGLPPTPQRSAKSLRFRGCARRAQGVWGAVLTGPSPTACRVSDCPRSQARGALPPPSPTPAM